MSCFLFQSPPKGATIPYRPKPQVGGPVILAGGQAYTIQGNYAVPAHSDVSTVLPLPAPAAGPTPPSLNTQTLTTSPFAAHPSSSAFAASHGHPLLSTAHLTTPHHPLHPSPLHASVAGLADPLLKSGHLQAALPPAHLVADAVSLLFFVIHPSSRYNRTHHPPTHPPTPPPSQEIPPPDPFSMINIKENEKEKYRYTHVFVRIGIHVHTYIYIYILLHVHVVRERTRYIPIIYVCIWLYILFVYLYFLPVIPLILGLFNTDGYLKIFFKSLFFFIYIYIARVSECYLESVFGLNNTATIGYNWWKCFVKRCWMLERGSWRVLWAVVKRSGSRRLVLS